MKRIHQFIALSATLLSLGLGRQNAAAQPGPPDMGNFDPQQMMQQMQQRMMDNIREQLGVTNDADWNTLQPLVSKVAQSQMDAQISEIRGMMRNMFGGAGGPPGGMPNFGTPDPDADALQKLVDDNAPHKQIRAALAKCRESRDGKAAELDGYREQLRKALTLRQEAILTSMGLLK